MEDGRADGESDAGTIVTVGDGVRLGTIVGDRVGLGVSVTDGDALWSLDAGAGVGLASGFAEWLQDVP